MSSSSPARVPRMPVSSRRFGSQTGPGRAAWVGACLAAAAALALLISPDAAFADPPHGHAFRGHFAADHGRRDGHFGGSHWHAGHAARDGRWARRGGDWRDHGRGDWHGGRGDGHRGDWHDRWYGGRGNDEHWHAGWGRGDWDHRHWRGALWFGGYWGGYYWPPVDYGWNTPWFMASIPFGAMTITFGGVPYYYINHVYYVWSPSYDGYVVADPPPAAGAVGTSSAAEPPPPPQADQGPGGVLGLRVTPLKGQNSQQTANDRYACNTWAVAQSGFNPLNGQQDAQASPQMRSDYRRAFTACLQARGYSVK